MFSTPLFLSKFIVGLIWDFGLLHLQVTFIKVSDSHKKNFELALMPTWLAVYFALTEYRGQTLYGKKYPSK